VSPSDAGFRSAHNPAIARTIKAGWRRAQRLPLGLNCLDSPRKLLYYEYVVGPKRRTEVSEVQILENITGREFKNRGHADQIRIVNDFAEYFGWNPSDYLGPEYGIPDRSNGHLIVEHGLQHAAVLTFIAEPQTGTDLSSNEARVLLEISYNNLVDFHLLVDHRRVALFFNRLDSPMIEEWAVERPDFTVLTADYFRKRLESVRAGNIPALDTVMIETVDYWKRFLHGELTCKRKNEVISALFNAIIFVRAVEDHFKLKHVNGIPTLIERWRRATNKDLTKVLCACLRAYKAGRGATSLLTLKRLAAFGKVHESIIENLISDFYRIKKTPYAYNFAMMSRHALSRIYEKYVALLHQEDDSKIKDKTLFPIELPEAHRNKAAGAIYTPQFIPRFFCRFIEDQIPPRVFKQLEIADPACGSGIFLRTFLERMSGRAELNTAEIKGCFKKVLGLDVDENACQASRLSLALLHLMCTDSLPSARSLQIIADEAIRYFEANDNLKEKFGAVIGNPPFVRLELQTANMRKRVQGFLSDIMKGRADLYLAILRLAMKMAKPEGYLAFVLPHSFLTGAAPAAMRQELHDMFWLRSVVDLSAINVFEDYGTYVVLLIAQKKGYNVQAPPACRVVLCQDFVGDALQACLENKTIRTPYYSVFDVDQGYFGKGPWTLLGPEEARLEEKLNRMSKVDDFFVVREGLVTGDDEKYVLAANKVPKEDEFLYAPLLADRAMQRYAVPATTGKCVYYPYREGKKIPEDELRKAKTTWMYLEKIRDDLGTSASATWPYLVRGREKDMMQPKIISPHLMLLPRFSLDAQGKYAVSHAPFLVPRGKECDLDFLKFFTAVLNSSVVYWYIGTHAYRYSRGYVMLDPKYVKHIPVPDPSRVAPTLVARLIALVDKRVKTGDIAIEEKIDEIALDAYGLSQAERNLLRADS